MTNAERRAATQKAAMEATMKQGQKKADPVAKLNFVKGMPLPEGFENPPIGEQEHRCTTRAGAYMPDWVQIEIQRVHDHQSDPQVFPLMGTEYSVKLDQWTDCPPGILESLKSAVETHHNYNATAGQIQLGAHPEHKTIERKRFVYRHLPSA